MQILSADSFYLIKFIANAKRKFVSEMIYAICNCYDLEIEQENKMLGLSLIIYGEAAKKYNTTLHKLFYRPPSLILGFKTVSENI